jgi:outer membrane lipoprotein carrier protein
MAFLLAGGQAGATGEPPKGYNKAFDILMAAKVQAYYATIEDYKAAFKHVYVKRYHGKQKPRYGYLWVKKPGKMYWRYDAPQKRHFICDGKKIWIYTPGDKQVLWRSVARSQLPSAVKFLWGSGNLLKEFYVKLLDDSKYGGEGKKVLKLKPIKPTSHYSHILFVVKPEGKVARVVETLVYDSLGNKNHYVFRNPKRNTKIQNSRFDFTPPKGVRVIHAARKAKMKP